MKVALLAEGVDKIPLCRPAAALGTSPSSRRAWIEINMTDLLHLPRRCRPSSRRAWIEIPLVEHSTYSLPRRPPRGGRG